MCVCSCIGLCSVKFCNEHSVTDSKLIAKSVSVRNRIGPCTSVSHETAFWGVCVCVCKHQTRHLHSCVPMASCQTETKSALISKPFVLTLHHLRCYF